MDGRMKKILAAVLGARRAGIVTMRQNGLISIAERGRWG